MAILGPILDKGVSWVEIEKHSVRQLKAWKTVLERQKVMEIGPTLTTDRLEQIQKHSPAKTDVANKVLSRYKEEISRISQCQ